MATNRMEFTKELFRGAKKLKAEWVDHVGYIKMSGGRVAKVYIDTMGTHDHYECAKCVIVDKLKGEVDRKVFRFGDHMEPTADGKLEVIAYCGWHWYNNGVKRPDGIANAVEQYLNIME